MLYTCNYIMYVKHTQLMLKVQCIRKKKVSYEFQINHLQS